MWGLRLEQFLAAAALLLTVSASTDSVTRDLTPKLESCKGYAASNVKKSSYGVSADLKLIGEGCAAYGKDVKQLKLAVNYDTGLFLP
jgi:alpha-glucosidase